MNSLTSEAGLSPKAIFRRDVIAGLGESPKRLACKYFYDQRGSELFDAICTLDEYYLTRTEDAIMSEFASEMGDQIGPQVMLIEFGSGSSTKTRHLLDALPDPVAYVPVDISQDHLLLTAERLKSDYPDFEILPVCADFTKPFWLPSTHRPSSHKAVYFPGSTIGNLAQSKAIELLKVIAEMCGSGGGLLIGIDLQKDIPMIEAAYNDRAGVTEEFNLNLLHRINAELNGTFVIDNFRHDAFYDQNMERMDIAIVSEKQQTVRMGEHEFRFAAGERIHTEYSHKYTMDGFAALAAKAGLTLRRSWTDPRELFAVLHLALLD